MSPDAIRRLIVAKVKEQTTALNFLVSYGCFLPSECLENISHQLEQSGRHVGIANKMAQRALREQVAVPSPDTTEDFGVRVLLRVFCAPSAKIWE